MDTMVLDRARRGFDRSYPILCGHFPASGHGDEPLATAPWIEVARSGDATWLLFPDERGTWYSRRLTSEVHALLECCQTPSLPRAIAAAIAAASGTDSQEIGTWVRLQLDALVQAGVLISGRLADALPAAAWSDSWDRGADRDGKARRSLRPGPPSLSKSGPPE